MAESQSRYGIIEELTQSMNNERQAIASRKATLENYRKENEQLKLQYVAKRNAQIDGFSQGWEDRRKAAAELERRFEDEKAAFKRMQQNEERDHLINMELRQMEFKSLEQTTLENNKASEEKIVELRSSIDALKEVSKESASLKEKPK